MRLEQALRQREIRRADLYSVVRAGRLLPAPYSGSRPQRARSARGQLMRPSCRSASGNLYVPVEPTALLYKEVPEFLHPSWHKQSADSPELFRLGPGAAARNLATGEGGVSW
jgi:hypothetical protein